MSGEFGFLNGILDISHCIGLRLTAKRVSELFFSFLGGESRDNFELLHLAFVQTFDFFLFFVESLEAEISFFSFLFQLVFKAFVLS